MQIIRTILLGLLAALLVTASVFLTVDGNLARLTGWYHYKPGDPLFPIETTSRLGDVSWMRIAGLHDTLECERDENGVWWIISPFRDRMSPEAVEAILCFTNDAQIVDTLPLNHTVRENMREFGVETMPHTITLKVSNGEHSHTTLARYTLGSTSPWLESTEDGTGLLPTTYLRTDFYGRDQRIHVVTGNILGLFRNGLPGLRDPHPLLLFPDQLESIIIDHQDGEKLVLTRASAEVDWVVMSPVVSAANQDTVNRLVYSLATMSALQVQDASEVTLPEKPACSITLVTAGNAEPVVLNLYEPFFSSQADQQVCYATVSDRPAVFTLRATPKVKRHGSYTAFIRGVYQLPVLDKQALAQVLSEVVYTDNLPLTLGALRSMSFARVNPLEVGTILIRAKKRNPRFEGDRSSLRIELVPGNPAGGIADSWLVAADGQVMDADTDIVRQFIISLQEVPALEVVADIHPGDDAREIRGRYGLNDPTYMVMIAPRPCAYHATIFGHDLPLVRTHEPRIFYINRFMDPGTGEGMWVGMESGGTTIYKLSPKLTRNISPDIYRWKQRTLIQFPISSLRKMTLNFVTATLELGYNYMENSWTGTFEGRDVTPNVNGNRAEHYVRQLMHIRVRQWLPPDDPEATRALRTPIFSVKLELELTDYSDVENVYIESSEDFASVSSAEIEQWLNDDDETGRVMRDLGTAERRTYTVTRTIEIVPIDPTSESTLFYGRIVETGEIFILDYNVAQGLGDSLLDL